jgi:protein dithiol oxidoreductase (disulfide-forming)
MGDDMLQAIRLLPLLLVWTAIAHGAAPVEGRDYTVLNPPQPTSDPSKVVVTEFFSYQCPHCAAFARPFSAWVKSLPTDVRVERMAVSIGHPQWVAAARAYPALLAMIALDKVDDAIFQAIHQQGVRLDTEAQWTSWLTSRGIDAEAFSTTYRSFGVDSQFRNAEARSRAARIPSIPTLVIDGRFLIAIADNGDFKSQLAMAAELIARVRQQRIAAVATQAQDTH